MSPKQKLFFTQLQLVSIGALIVVFGIIWNQIGLFIFGICIVIYSLIRFFLFRRLLDLEEPSPELVNEIKVGPIFSLFSEEEEDEEDWPISQTKKG